MVECRYRALKKVTWHCRLFQPMPEVQWSWDFVCAKINVEIWLNVAKFCLYLLIIFLRVSSALSILLILFLFEMKCRNKTMKFCSYLVFSGKQILFYRKSICFKNFHIVIFAVRSKGGGQKSLYGEKTSPWTSIFGHELYPPCPKRASIWKK